MEPTHPLRPRLGELLLGAGLVDESQLRGALAEQERWGNRLGVTLVRMGVLAEEDLVRALAVQLGLPVARMRGKRVSPEALELVPADLAERHRCLPLFTKEEGRERVLYVAMEDPSDLEALDALASQIGVGVRPVLVAPTELEEARQRHYHGPVAGPSGLDGAEADADRRPELLVVKQLGSREPAPAPASASAGPVGADAILRALSQLLVEKGILTREELVERVGAIAGQGGGRSAA